MNGWVILLLCAVRSHTTTLSWRVTWIWAQLGQSGQLGLSLCVLFHPQGGRTGFLT